MVTFWNTLHQLGNADSFHFSALMKLKKRKGIDFGLKKIFSKPVSLINFTGPRKRFSRFWEGHC